MASLKIHSLTANVENEFTSSAIPGSAFFLTMFVFGLALGYPEGQPSTLICSDGVVGGYPGAPPPPPLCSVPLPATVNAHLSPEASAFPEFAAEEVP